VASTKRHLVQRTRQLNLTINKADNERYLRKEAIYL